MDEELEKLLEDETLDLADIEDILDDIDSILADAEPDVETDGENDGQ